MNYCPNCATPWPEGSEDCAACYFAIEEFDYRFRDLTPEREPIGPVHGPRTALEEAQRREAMEHGVIGWHMLDELPSYTSGPIIRLDESGAPSIQYRTAEHWLKQWGQF